MYETKTQSLRVSHLSCITAATSHSPPTAGAFSVPQSTLKSPGIRQQSGLKQTLEEKAPVLSDGRSWRDEGTRTVCRGRGEHRCRVYKSSAGLSSQSWSTVE